MNKDKILQIENLHLELGETTIIDNLSMELWQGHIHAVVGPNGAGKTSLASCIMGLAGYKSAAGRILFKGEDISNLLVDERARRGITMAWQEPARFEGLSVEDFIKASVKGDKDIKPVLKRMGLEPETYLRRAVDDSLSGGERKKVELASIMAGEAQLVIMDEPDSGIDVESLERIFEAVKFLKQNGRTVIFITHSLAVLKQADHAFLMCGGKVVDKGVTEKITPYFEGKCLPCECKNEPYKGEIKNEH
ncbi:MAG: ATP-binding cassette domain-containing protein [Elusimicrobiota bacterium]